MGQGHEIAIGLPNRDLESNDPEMLKQEFETEYARLGFICLNEEIEFRAFALEVVADADPLAWPQERYRAKSKPAETSMLSHAEHEALAQPSGKRPAHNDQSEEAWHFTYERMNLRVGELVRGPASITEPYTTTSVTDSFNCWLLSNGFLQLQARANVAERTTRQNGLWLGVQGPCIENRLAWARLLAIMEEQAHFVLRSAFCPLIRESGAVLCGALSVSGQLIAQSELSCPSLTGSLLHAAAATGHLQELQSLAPDHCFVNVNPGACRSQADIMVVSPVHSEGRLMAYVAAVARTTHLPSRAATISRGAISQLGEAARDIAALVASCDLARRRLLALLAEKHLTVQSFSEYILKESQQALLKNMQGLQGKDYKSSRNIKIREGLTYEVKLTSCIRLCDTHRLSICLSADGQSSKAPTRKLTRPRGSPAYVATSFARFACMAILGRDVPVNSGSWDTLCVEVETGSLLDAAPADAASDPAQLAYFLPDLIFDCLAVPLQERIPAESSACSPGVQWRSDDLQSQMILNQGGGMGAHMTKDGTSTLFPSGIQSIPVEIAEMAGAVLFKCKELISDSAGAGQSRGGMGVRWQLEARQAMVAEVTACRDGPVGRQGGGNGTPSALQIKRKGDGLESDMSYAMNPGDVLQLETAGGGGFGPPVKRRREAVLHDVREGYISKARAISDYGLSNSDLEKQSDLQNE